MEWTVQDLGAVGEFVGAIAVVVTLVYLARQIRQSAQATKAATYQDVYRDLRENLKNIPVEIVRKIRAGEPLDAMEQNEINLWRITMIRGYENWYRQYRYGTIDRDVFEAYISHARRTFAEQEEARAWLAYMASSESHLVFTEGFLDFLISYVDSGEPGILWQDARERWMEQRSEE